jgi:hypothetical protein
MFDPARSSKIQRAKHPKSSEWPRKYAYSAQDVCMRSPSPSSDLFPTTLSVSSLHEHTQTTLTVIWWGVLNYRFELKSHLILNVAPYVCMRSPSLSPHLFPTTLSVVKLAWTWTKLRWLMRAKGVYRTYMYRTDSRSNLLTMWHVRRDEAHISIRLCIKVF